MKSKTALTIFSIAVITIGCEKTFNDPVDGNYKRPSLPDETYHYTLTDADIPSHIFSGSSSFLSGIDDITNEGATLGRVLFYDKALSINNATACASCHHQEKGFADVGAKSVGFNSGETKRNSPSCVNMLFNSRFFWDGRAQSLDEQVLMPVADHIEMGLDDPSYLVKKVQTLDYYEPLFENAFGSAEVTHEKIGSALAQFLRSMISYRSKYDVGVEIEFANFSVLEKEGYDLFFSWDRVHCANCHSGENFAGWSNSFANIGLEMEYADKGLGAMTGNELEEGRFKVPSLRNVALTAPYMHDGRFETLEEVVEHYNSGVVAHPNLDWNMTNAGFVTFEDFAPQPSEPSRDPRRLELTEREKQSLVAFMKTLSDFELTTDERFSNPFK